MRILHISPGKLYGGVESFQVTMARHRALCSEIEPEFVVCFDRRLAKELRLAGVPVHIIGDVQVRKPLSIVRARRRLGVVLHERRFDVAICHMPWTNAIFGPTIRAARLPLVFWAHVPPDGKHWTERWCRLSPPDLAIAPSAFMASVLPKIFPGMKAEVVNCPVAPPTDLYASATEEARKELYTDRNQTVIAHVGRLDPVKGHVLLIESLHLIRNDVRWTCWMVAPVQRKEDAERIATVRRRGLELGISDRIRIVGERSDIPRLLAAANIYCQPNIAPEGMGIVFAEAMYAGLPVVTTRMGGFNETIDDSCGMLTEPNALSVSSALGRLIEDADLRARLAHGARTRAYEKFHPSRQLPKLARLLSEACKEYRRS